MKKPRVGFIGLGTMGMPMATRLLEAGYPLTVYNRTQKKMMGLVGKGATGADSPKSVAALSRIIITMLPDSPDVAAVMLDANGIIEGAGRGSVVIDMSSILPSVARTVAEKLTEKGVAFLDAPVSGSKQGAEDGTLSIMVGGQEQTLAAVRPVLEVLGKTIVLVGNSGAGQIAKLGNQIIVASNLLSLAAAILQAERAGIDPRKAVAAWQGGLAANRVLKRKAEMMIARSFTPAQFKASLHLKDLRNAEKSIREQVALSVPFPDAVTYSLNPNIEFVVWLCRMFAWLVRHGYGEEDHAGIIRALENRE